MFKASTRLTFPFLFLTLVLVLLLIGSTVSVAQTFTTLYTFPGGSAGLHPGGLVFGKSGALYGWTSQGGIPKSCSPTASCGTVFQLKPPSKVGGKWTKTTIYAFQNYADGATPAGRFLTGNHGELYGVTSYGGSSGYGAVFQLTPPVKTGGTWIKSEIYSFNGTDGANPVAGVVADTSGNLYGTTLNGGTYGEGTMFELMPPVIIGGPWTETVIHSFNPYGLGHDGYHPRAELLMSPSGGFYGTTSDDQCALVCGTLFFNGGWINLFGGYDGGRPTYLTFRKGALDGITLQGGGVHCGQGCGTVFEWTGSQKLILYIFDGTFGSFPDAILADSSGALYGAAGAGGANSSCFGGCGTIFKLSLVKGQWTPTLLYNFTGGTDGYAPSSLIRNAGVFYGTTEFGGNPTACKGKGCGTVFKIQ